MTRVAVLSFVKGRRLPGVRKSNLFYEVLPVKRGLRSERGTFELFYRISGTNEAEDK